MPFSVNLNFIPGFSHTETPQIATNINKASILVKFQVEV